MSGTVASALVHRRFDVLESRCLVGGVPDMAEGRARQVDSDDEVRRLEVVDHSQQRIREAEYSARVLAGAFGDQRCVLQGVVGAMDDAVTIKDREKRLAMFGGCHGSNYTRRGAPTRWTKSRKY